MLNSKQDPDQHAEIENEKRNGVARKNNNTETKEEEELGKYLNPDCADQRAFWEGGASGEDKI